MTRHRVGRGKNGQVFMAIMAFIALILMAGPLAAQEVCGLANVQFDDLLADGFEALGAASNAAPVAGQVATASSASQRALTIRDLGPAVDRVAPLPTGVAPTLTIVAPVAGASLPGRAFEVRGTFTGPPNTGITVNDVPARTFGNQWVATALRPPAGAFAIDAVAHTFDGLSASAARSVTLGNAEPPLSILASQPTNLAPATIGFTLRFPFGAMVGNVQIDFDNDGNDDYNGPAASAPSNFRYANAGFYTARVQALVDGNPAVAETTVVIADVVANRQRACAVYGALRSALAADDLEASLRAFIDYQREALRPFFTALGSNRPVFATRLGSIANGLIGTDRAALTVLHIDNGEPIGTPLEIAADGEGVWRITGF